MTWSRISVMAMVALAVVRVPTGNGRDTATISLAGPTGIGGEECAMSASSGRNSTFCAGSHKVYNKSADAFLRDGFTHRLLHSERITTSEVGIKKKVKINTLKEKRSRLLTELKKLYSIQDGQSKQRLYKQDLDKRSKFIPNKRMGLGLFWAGRSKIFRSDLGK